MLFPLAVDAYCAGRVVNLHVRPRYDRLRSRFGDGLRRLQHRDPVPGGRWRGGITVCDALGRRSGGWLFRQLLHA